MLKESKNDACYKIFKQVLHDQNLDADQISSESIFDDILEEVAYKYVKAKQFRIPGKYHFDPLKGELTPEELEIAKEMEI